MPKKKKREIQKTSLFAHFSLKGNEHIDIRMIYNLGPVLKQTRDMNELRATFYFTAIVTLYTTVNLFSHTYAEYLKGLINMS